MEGAGVCCVLPFAFLLFYVFFLVWARVVKKHRPKHYRLWLWASVPAFVAVLVCCVVPLSFYVTRPSVIFRNSVGFSPTPDVKILHSLRHMPTDWDDTYLVFYADQSTIDRILQDGFTLISAKDIVEYSNTPAWWVPRTGDDAKIYATNVSDRPQPFFAYWDSHRLLIYEPNTKKVYFRYRRP
jgi:hypothetical protein